MNNYYLALNIYQLKILLSLLIIIENKLKYRSIIIYNFYF